MNLYEFYFSILSFVQILLAIQIIYSIIRKPDKLKTHSIMGALMPIAILLIPLIKADISNLKIVFTIPHMLLYLIVVGLKGIFMDEALSFALNITYFNCVSCYVLIMFSRLFYHKHNVENIKGKHSYFPFGALYVLGAFTWFDMLHLIERWFMILLASVMLVYLCVLCYYLVINTDKECLDASKEKRGKNR